MITDKLDRFLNNENRFDAGHYGLRHIEALLDHFGNPHWSVPAIHIAGTNGKGSVAHMVSSILITGGYRAGLYTSPHLLELNERIRLDGLEIADDILSRYIDDITAYTEHNPAVKPTYFDVLTACAFRYFSDAGADCAVIETGLGGRLDSTNVITPICSVITDISLDHCGILGNTIREIAEEKAGIIKEGIPVVTSNTAPEALEPIVDTAVRLQAPLYRFGIEFTASSVAESDAGYRFDYRCAGDAPAILKSIAIHHPVKKQVANGSCAITASVLARPRFPGLTDDAVRKGLDSFSAPGRFQVLLRHPMIIFDPAHNPAALDEVLRTVKRKYPRYHSTLVLSLMKDKDIPGIMAIIAAAGFRAVYIVLNDPRCMHPGKHDYPEVITEIVGDDNEMPSALDRLVSEDTLLLFTGSFRLYRAALKYAGHRNGNNT